MALHYILIISGTDLIKYPGISAAGGSHDLLKYTACLDAEFIHHGFLKTLDKLPVSPAGIVSPALIAKACLNILDTKITIIDAGAHVKPQCPYISLRDKPGGDISIEPAMSNEEAKELFDKASALTIDPNDELIITECVVGGTSTAYSLLRGFGYECQGMVSSSLPQGNHSLKEELVGKALWRHKEILRFAQDDNKQAQDDNLAIVASLGDPMQIVASALAIKADKQKQSVTLAGGTQMIAVKAFIDRLADNSSASISPSPWIINDKSANFTKLLDLVSPGTSVQSCTEPSSATLGLLVKELSASVCARQVSLEEIIEQYNKGHVKEGLGMGALLYKVTEATSELGSKVTNVEVN